MPLTDEQVLDAYIAARGTRPAAKALAMPHTTVRNRLAKMQAAGVKISRMDKRGGFNDRVYTPERVSELNDYIQRKTQETNTGQV